MLFDTKIEKTEKYTLVSVISSVYNKKDICC